MRKRMTAQLLALCLGGMLLSGCTLYDRLVARHHLNKGVTAYKNKLYDDAVAEFKKAVELDPTLTPARLYLAITYRAQWVPGARSPENLEKAHRAIQTFEEVLEYDPTNLNAMSNIAGIYNGLDQPDKAKEWYQKLIETNPDNPEHYYGIGTIDWQLSYDRTGMNGEGVETMSEEEKAEVNALVDEGVEMMKRALELDPRYTNAMEYLNLLYREKAKLTPDEEEKKRWEREADRLALEALQLKKKIQEEEERKARQIFGRSEDTSN